MERRYALKSFFVSSDDQRLLPAWRILAQAAIMLICFVPAVWITQVVQNATQGAINRDYLGTEFTGILAITSSVFISRKWIDQRSIGSLGFRFRKLSLLDFVVGLAVSGFLLGGIVFLEYVLGWVRWAGFAWFFKSWNTIISKMLYFFLIYLAIGWQEELLFRGYQFQNLLPEKAINFNWQHVLLAMLLSSAIFSIKHLANPDFSVLAVVGLMLIGVFLCFCFWASRSLWLGIGFHLGWNYFQGPTLGLNVSGNEMFHLTMLQNNGPVIMTGGAFGIEASLWLLPFLALGAAFILIYCRFTRRKPSPQTLFEAF